MSKTVWVLQEWHNQYDQMGPTLEMVWTEKPPVEELFKFFEGRIHGCKATTVEGVIEFVNSEKIRHRFNHSDFELSEIETGVRLSFYE